MTTPLRTLLDDLAGSVPVADPGLAGRAWRQGRRDRSRRRWGSVAAAAGVLAVLSLVAPLAAVPAGAPSFAGAPDATVAGHPERVGRQWWVRDLPDRPGPVAALLETVVDRGTYDEAGGWQAVSADGHRWRLPGDVPDGQVPALSPDGRLLGRLVDPLGPYVVHDLVTGERTTFPTIGGSGAPDPDRPDRLTLQSPGHWSPDARRLVLNADQGALVLDVRTREVTRLPDRLGTPAGWAGPERPLFLRSERTQVRLRTTDLTGRVVAEVALREPPAGTSQWSGVVAPDGRRVALLSDGVAGTAGVRTYDLATGEPVGPPLPVDVTMPCGGTWSRGGLVVPVRDGDTLVAQEVRGGGRVTTVAPAAGGTCLVWAADALAGPPQAAPRLGHDRPLLLAGLLGAVALLALLRRRSGR